MNGRNVPPEAIGAAPPEPLGQPPGPVGPDPLTRDPDLDKKLGWLGRAFGHGEDKKGNIAGITIVVFFVFLVGCVVAGVSLPEAEDRSFVRSLITPIFGVITGAIGFITGRRE